MTMSKAVCVYYSQPLWAEWQSTQSKKHTLSPNPVDFHEGLLIFIFIFSVYPFPFFFLFSLLFFNLIDNVFILSHKQEGVALNIPESGFYLGLLNS